MKDTFLAILVLIVGVPIVLGFAYVVLNRRVAFAAGWALAQWIAAERWRAPGATVLIGLVALGVAQWASKLHEPKLFVFFVVVMFFFLGGITGFDYGAEAGSGPSGVDEGWWRRSRCWRTARQASGVRYELGTSGAVLSFSTRGNSAPRRQTPLRCSYSKIQ
jgi:hypothetical protein